MRTKQLLVIAIVVYLIALGSFLGRSMGPPQPGPYGSDHAHLYFAVDVNGDRIDFSQDRYQLADRRAHFENNDGEILHLHAERITVDYVLRSLRIGFNGTCISVGKRSCTNSTHDLRVYVDGEAIDDRYHVLEQGENVMVWYGPEDGSPDEAFFQQSLPQIYRPGSGGRSI